MNITSVSCILCQDALVEAVAAVNKNTIVVINAVGPINMEAWVTNPNVTAIVRCHKHILRDYNPNSI